MILATVIGTVVATHKCAGLEGVRFLLVQPEDETGKPSGGPVVAADAMQAGPADRVLVVLGREGTFALPVSKVPVDCVIVGHVDETG